MTFKHVKFEDSAVMRSLEKLAREKGLVKDEPITKAASSNVSLSPSASLTENVLHLCAGLRASGFDKHANELEERFLAYKQAQTLYETSSEKGEDLVDRAHPKGSHKLEDVEGDEAVFETIVDKHLKSIKMVEKQPTGKLASSKDVLGAVKTVLAQAPKIDFGPMPAFEEPFVSPDGAKANAAYVSYLKKPASSMGQVYAGLVKTKQLIQTDNRIPNQRGIITKLDQVMGTVENMTKKMYGGVDAAAKTAKQLESQRKSQEAYRNDRSYALIAWSEVSKSINGIGGPMSGVGDFLTAMKTLAGGVVEIGTQVKQGITQLADGLPAELQGIGTEIKYQLGNNVEIAISNCRSLTQ